VKAKKNITISELNHFSSLIKESID